MPSVYTQASKFYASFNENRCAAAVGHSYRTSQCARKPVDIEDGYAWCRQHLPSEERKRMKASDARFRAQLNTSPIVRLGIAVKQRQMLEDAIDAFLASSQKPEDTEKLREARFGSSLLR